MKLSVMQPYIFPYIGYYQLIKNSDIFVVYDDANYIKQGYINRNNILVNNEMQRFTIPVPKASSNKKISELSYSNDVNKFLQTIKQAYSKSPYFLDVFPMIESIINYSKREITDLCINEYTAIFSYLGINVNIIKSSSISYNRSLSASDKLIDMANELGCESYVNTFGGQSLYDKSYFTNKKINLSFIKIKDVSYEQGFDGFVSNLSILDILMWNAPEDIVKLLDEYEVLQ